MELTGAQILLESLKKEGVDVLFGYPGGAVIDIYDELPRHPELKHVLVRHEQGAVHAADGYARASGKVGCCLVTSGPGATNTVTGIATAYCDSIPLVVFTGQVPTQLIGNDAFQEVDIVGITRPCTKHNFLVKDVRNLAKTIRQAFYLARSGRPGPVLVDLPKDIMQARTEFVWPEDIFMRSYNPTYKPNLNQLRRTAEELAKARKPIILAGGGVPVMGKTGHAFMKERMRAEDAVYGGEMSAHHYFRDFAYCDSGMLPWLLVIAAMQRHGKPLAELVRERMEAWPCSGEINRRVADARP